MAAIWTIITYRVGKYILVRIEQPKQHRSSCPNVVGTGSFSIYTTQLPHCQSSQASTYGHIVQTGYSRMKTIVCALTDWCSLFPDFIQNTNCSLWLYRRIRYIRRFWSKQMSMNGWPPERRSGSCLGWQTGELPLLSRLDLQRIIKPNPCCG